MISKFDRSCASALYKRQFGECLEDFDYEGALDCLHKFSAETNDPDFHIACGMLYLLMTQDSDDSELLTLAFREFMMYLRRNPNSVEAYRNIIATVFLRREPVALFEWGKRLRESGLDCDKVFDELAQAGISQLIPTDSDFLDLENLFNAGDFGRIDPQYDKKTASDTVSDNKSEDDLGLNKIISFRGITASDSNAVITSKTDKILHIDKIEQASVDDRARIVEGVSEPDAESLLEFIKSLTDGDDGIEIKVSDSQSASVKKSQIRAGLALQEAEIHSEHGNYEKALEALDTIKPEDGRLYYCGECVRAFILLEQDDVGGAFKATKRALEIQPDGALAGTLMCRIYEKKKQFAKIPLALKKINIKDFVDSDHVYKAMRYAVKYCDIDDALDLAEEYIEEYNIMDVRMLYAQLLYNSGDKESATEELYLLSRIFYDDFNTVFYYIMARGGIDKMPLSEEAPQEILGMLIDDVMKELKSGLENKLFDDDMLSVALETFLTLEFDNDRRTMIAMFDALRIMATLPSLREKVLDALVSPYVEPLVKAVLLSELYAQGENDLLFEIGYCPIFEKDLPQLNGTPARGVRTAYAFIAVLRRDKLAELIELANKIYPNADNTQFSDREIANYLIKKVRGRGKLMDKSTDGRIDYALGYGGKTAATQAYKSVASILDPIVSGNEN